MSETDIGPEDANERSRRQIRTHRHPGARSAVRRGTPGYRCERRESRGRRRPRPVGWLVIAVPVVTAFAVGGYEIGGPSLWRDEAYTKDAIGRPVSQIFALLGHQDAVHGAYYILMHVIAAAVGTSATALRFPSLCAMVIATGFTAAIGRRAAALALAPDAGRASRLDIPALTGLLSGLVFATAPYMTFYAQMARSYAIETMFATIATYLLLRAYPDGRWRWWSAYGAAVALTGLFNIFGLLILAAHGVTLLLTDARGQSANGRRIGRIPLRWLAASAAAVIVLSPLLGVARQPAGADRLADPAQLQAIERLLTALRGLEGTDRPVRLARPGWPRGRLPGGQLAPAEPRGDSAAVAGRAAVRADRGVVRQAGLLRAVRRVLPARAGDPGRRGPGRADQARCGHAARQAGAWPGCRGVAALVTAGLAVLLAGPQQAIRQTAARPDNLRLASAIVAAHEQPGDVVFYIPADMQVLGTGYPAPFLRLRDIALASPRSPRPP